MPQRTADQHLSAAQPRRSPKTKADLLRERAKHGRKIAEIDLALANLETGDAAQTCAASPATIGEIVALAIGHAEVRPTRRAI